MDSRVPLEVQDILKEYIDMFHNRIPNTLIGLYLHGSTALNAYVHGSSDIDFIALTNKQLTEADMKVMADIHQSLACKYKKPLMDGQYITFGDMGKAEIERCLNYYDYGRLQWDASGPNPVTWWILRKSGIAIIGPETTAFHFEVDIESLAKYVFNNLNTYWARRIKRKRNSKPLLLLLPNKLIEWDVVWSITGMLRQYYTLKEHDIISKMDACEYALHHMPEKWHPIINDAMNIKKGLDRHYFVSKKQRINETIECMGYIIDCCNSL